VGRCTLGEVVRQMREQPGELTSFEHGDSHAVVAEDHEHRDGRRDGEPGRLDVAEGGGADERDHEADQQPAGGEHEVGSRHAACVLLEMAGCARELTTEDATEDEADRAAQDDEENDDEGLWEPDLARPVDHILDHQPRESSQRGEHEAAQLNDHGVRRFLIRRPLGAASAATPFL
jgi:hypothetical protein